MMQEVLHSFGFDPEQFELSPLGSGLIHQTWLVKAGGVGSYVLQEVNTSVFKKPGDIAANMDLLEQHLREFHPAYFLPLPIKTLTGKPFVQLKGETFRMFHFVRNSHAFTRCETPQQAYEAARQFGNFTAAFSHFNAEKLNLTIPGFHDLSHRWAQFQYAIKNGSKERLKKNQNDIDLFSKGYSIVETFELIKSDKDFKQHVIHHDTKISNILFDDMDKGICVIDLDTVMPGYFISDLGDMMRTYLSPADEEEKDFSKISIRTEYVEAILKGYLEKMSVCLSEKEIRYCFYSGEFMIYMQALRFMTDHLNNDQYYGARYENHNLVRALNQICLLEQYRKIKPEFQSVMASFGSPS
ncbi:aminoglycoside phosphotransferase family protein [Pollutibacter soli]|uniref:phosphotransferase enzyme family protein n=1 Tax=Pollutibacter soli TaxID=3034157 RepID=UPI0030138EE6